MSERVKGENGRSTQIGPIGLEIGVIVEWKLVGTSEIEIENSHATLQGSIDSLDGGLCFYLRSGERRVTHIENIGRALGDLIGGCPDVLEGDAGRHRMQCSSQLMASLGSDHLDVSM